ncbi:MAG: shikimate kinase [Halobacteriovoraceae bacterium]|nr:shikimate kinase [Halobacteriovoraceae bacterium]MCB9093619.1 shikimate kinase [Halobacteriovoraceae bacterium]
MPFSTDRRPLALIGFMGAGKTTLLQELSRHWDLTGIDLDHYIEQKQGLSIAKLVEKEGWEYFRNLEYISLQEILNFQNIDMLALGGGTLQHTPSRKLVMKNFRTLYLDVSLNTLEKRLKDSHASRPLLRTQSLEKLYQERYPFYQKCQFHKNIEGLTMAQLSENVYHDYFEY